jgi:O-antigen/teichoic acid export membrane protein
MPAAATLRVQGREGELVGLLHHWSKVAAFLVTTLGGYLLVFGPEFLAWWLGPEYDPAAGRLLQVLMASFLLFLPVRGVALPILLGAGNPRGPGLGLMAMGLGNLVLSLALVREHGLLGVALGTAIPNALFALAFVARTARALHTRAGAWLGHALGRVTVGWLPGLALLVAVKLGPGAEGFWPLVAVGLAYSATQLAVGVLFIWRGDAQLDPLARWRARGGAAA